MNHTVFIDYARYYDLLYHDKDYPAEADYVDSLIRRFCPEAGSILELGSGTGKHAILLASKGYEVVGVELSEQMLSLAHKNASNPPILQSSNLPTFQPSNPLFLHGDIRSIRLNRTFDAVVALFHVISYQTTNEDVLASFRTAYNHLNPGGIFIFDIWYGPAVLSERPEVRIKRVENESMEIIRIAEPQMRPNENLVDVHYQIFIINKETQQTQQTQQTQVTQETQITQQTQVTQETQVTQQTQLTQQTQQTQLTQETHTMRYFFKPEIELFASQAGFKVLLAEEWLTGAQLGTSTWSACFCLKSYIR